MTGLDQATREREAYAEERAFWLRNAGRHYDEAELPFIRWHQGRVRANFAIAEGEALAEVGCGPGKLYGDHARVLLVDFSPEILARARTAMPHVAAVCASVDALPFRDHCLERIVANNMLHHVKGEGLLAAAVAEFRRVLRPEGRLYVNDRNPTLVHHAIILASNGAKRLLRRCYGEFAGCGSFNEPLFLRRDWAVIERHFAPERTATYYSALMWSVDSLAKGLAVILRRRRSFVASLQQAALPWLGPCERLPRWAHIERSVVLRPRA